VSVSVVEERHGVAFHFGVPAGEALDAFRHPYAYAADASADDAVTA
jgi:hypothetical protein